LRLPSLEDQVPVFIFPSNRIAQLYPRALGSFFVTSYDSQVYGGGILTHLHTGLLFLKLKSLGVIFDKKIPSRLHIEMVTTKAYITFMRLHSLFKSDGLSTNSKLTLHKALIRSIMTCACPSWEFAADTHLMELQRLQN
jgi:hypothetical protein